MSGLLSVAERRRCGLQAELEELEALGDRLDIRARAAAAAVRPRRLATGASSSEESPPDFSAKAKSALPGPCCSSSSSESLNSCVSATIEKLWSSSERTRTFVAFC